MSKDEDFRCNKCGGELAVRASTGNMIDITGAGSHYPTAIMYGCPYCNMIVAKRLLLIEAEPKKLEEIT